MNLIKFFGERTMNKYVSIAYERFYDASTSEVIGARNELFFMIMMTNDIWGCMGPNFSHIYLII